MYHLATLFLPSLAVSLFLIFFSLFLTYNCHINRIQTKVLRFSHRYGFSICGMGASTPSIGHEGKQSCNCNQRDVARMQISSHQVNEHF
jgi:hypothetical protein